MLPLHQNSQQFQLRKSPIPTPTTPDGSIQLVSFFFFILKVAFLLQHSGCLDRWRINGGQVYILNLVVVRERSRLVLWGTQSTWTSTKNIQLDYVCRIIYRASIGFWKA